MVRPEQGRGQGARSGNGANQNGGWEEQRQFMMESIGQLAQSLASQVVRRERTPAVDLLEKFMRQNPPSFAGEVDPEKAESWVNNMEKIFRAMSCPTERRVDLATYRFAEEAEHWWRATRDIKFEEEAVISWEEFLEVFNEKYFPEHVQEKKRQEFLMLAQNKLTLAEYISKFNKLEKYCPGVYGTPKERASKFTSGLILTLRTKVQTSRPQTLAEAIECTTVLDDDHQEYLLEMEKHRKRSSSSNSGNQTKNRFSGRSDT